MRVKDKDAVLIVHCRGHCRGRTCKRERERERERERDRLNYIHNFLILKPKHTRLEGKYASESERCDCLPSTRGVKGAS